MFDDKKVKGFVQKQDLIDKKSQNVVSERIVGDGIPAITKYSTAATVKQLKNQTETRLDSDKGILTQSEIAEVYFGPDEKKPFQNAPENHEKLLSVPKIMIHNSTTTPLSENNHGISNGDSLESEQKAESGFFKEVEKIAEGLSLFKPSGEEDIGQIIDVKMQGIVSLYIKSIHENRNYYRSVKKKINKEIKEKKHELKAEKRQYMENPREELFNSSQSSFKSDEYYLKQFEKFRFEKSSEQKQNLFIEPSSKPKSDNPFETSNLSSQNIETDKSKGLSAFWQKNRQDYHVRQPYEQELSDTRNSLSAKKEEKSEIKRKERKEVRKAAAVASVSKMLETKKNISNELMNGDRELTGDLLADGNSGLTRTITATMFSMLKIGAKKMVSELGKLAWKIISYVFGIIWPFLLVIMIIMGFIGALFSAFSGAAEDSDTGATSYEIDVGTSGSYHSEAYSAEEIDDIITTLYGTYPEMTVSQEQVLRQALSAIGGAYDQGSHSNHEDNIWDCSELAYCSYMSAGIDISNNGYYTAAEECRAMADSGYTMTGDFTLQPGDLLFYGGSDNGRYLGVYHVAIYLGNFDGVDRMVEAYGTSRGVIESDVRTNNLVNISRPIV